MATDVARNTFYLPDRRFSFLSTNKPFLTYNQQISLMRNKGIVIENEIFTKEVLQSISYYGIVNGYKDIFGTFFNDELNIEQFNEPVSFASLHRIFLIDQALNNLLFKYIIYIEKSLKTKLSYKIAQKIGVSMLEYLDFEKYKSNGELDRKSEISNIKNQIDNNKNSASIQHYRIKHGDIPPWVATGGIYFGTTINWYKICREDIKIDIANQFFEYSELDGENAKELLLSMLSLLQEYRNNIAHGNRTFLSNVTNELTKVLLLSALSKEILTEEEYLSGIGKKDLFAVMISIAVLINDPIVFRQYLYDFGALFTNDEFNPKINYSPRGDIYATLNIPEDFLNRIAEIYKIKFL